MSDWATAPLAAGNERSWSFVLRRVRDGGLHGVLLTAVATSWILVFAVMRGNPRSAGYVDQVSGLRTDQPWATWLVRLPGSLFAPALRLPVWGAVLQVAVIGAIAETVVGRRRMAVAAVVAHIIASLLGRLATGFGPDAWTALASSRDTGPSVAVVALAIATAVGLRRPLVAAAVAAPLVIHAVLVSNLAGFEHLVAIAVGATIGTIWSRDQIHAAPPVPNPSRATLLQTRRIAAALVGTAGAVDVVRAIGASPARTGVRTAIDMLPFTVGVRHTEFAIVVGILLILLARGLRRGHSVAWSVTVVMAACRLMLPPRTIADTVELLLTAAFLVSLVGYRRAFRAPGRIGVVRRGLQVVVTTALAIGGVVALAARDVARGQRDVPFAHVMVSVLQRLPGTLDRRLGHWFELSGTLLLGGALWLVTRPAPCPLAGDRTSRAHARSCVETWGSDTLSFFALRDDKTVFFHESSVVAYTVRGAVAVVSPDPIGPLDERAEVWAAFRGYAQGNGWSVVVLAAGSDWLPTYLADDLHAVYIGDEAIVDVAEFSLAGGRKKGLRQAAARIGRNGYTATFHDPASIGAELATDLRMLVAKSRRGNAERGFSMTLGRYFDPDDTGMLLAVCRDGNGRPVAFCTFVPAPAIGGWSLDAMRRDRGEHPNGLLDFLLVETIAHVKAQGARGICLNFATMRSIVADGTVTGFRRRAIRWLLRKGSESMQIESLWHYNAKFEPSWSPRYAVFEQLADVPDALLAIARVESIWELPLIGRLLARQRSRRSDPPAVDADERFEPVDAR